MLSTGPRDNSIGATDKPHWQPDAILISQQYDEARHDARPVTGTRTDHLKATEWTSAPPDHYADAQTDFSSDHIFRAETVANSYA